MSLHTIYASSSKFRSVSQGLVHRYPAALVTVPPHIIKLCDARAPEYKDGNYDKTSEVLPTRYSWLLGSEFFIWSYRISTKITET